MKMSNGENSEGSVVSLHAYLFMSEVVQDIKQFLATSYSNRTNN